MTTAKPPVLLSIAYLPPIEWFAYLQNCEVILEANETYPKQTYRNRCYIYAEKGSMALSIPVTKPNGNHTLTRDIRILNEKKWYLKHWRAIQAAYEASPYFLYYKDDLKGFYRGNYDVLYDFDRQLISRIAELIGIQSPLRFTETYQKEPVDLQDCRELIHPKKNYEGKTFPAYIQVFADRHGFIPNLSILDLLFNIGPESKSYLNTLPID